MCLSEIACWCRYRRCSAAFGKKLAKWQFIFFAATKHRRSKHHWPAAKEVNIGDRNASPAGAALFFAYFLLGGIKRK
jgi:hypothetical protein